MATWQDARQYVKEMGLGNLNRSDLSKAVSTLSAVANKRLKRFEAADIQYGNSTDEDAISGVKKFGSKGKSLEELRYEYSRVTQFLDSERSTMSGAKEQVSRFKKRAEQFKEKTPYEDAKAYVESNKAIDNIAREHIHDYSKPTMAEEFEDTYGDDELAEWKKREKQQGKWSEHDSNKYSKASVTNAEVSAFMDMWRMYNRIIELGSESKIQVANIGYGRVQDVAFEFVKRFRYTHSIDEIMEMMSEFLDDDYKTTQKNKESVKKDMGTEQLLHNPKL